MLILSDKDMKINEEILKKIKENCNGDIAMEELLEQLIFEESFHSKSWHWKDEYEKRIADSLKE